MDIIDEDAPMDDAEPAEIRQPPMHDGQGDHPEDNLLVPAQ